MYLYICIDVCTIAIQEFDKFTHKVYTYVYLYRYSFIFIYLYLYLYQYIYISVRIADLWNKIMQSQSVRSSQAVNSLHFEEDGMYVSMIYL